MYTSVNNLPSSLRCIIATVEQKTALDSATAKSIIEQANVRAEDLARWTLFDHPRSDSYGRALIYDGGFFELMTMAWSPGDFSAIHDHGYTQWGAVQIFGPAEHAVFRVDTDEITTVSVTHLTPGQIIPVSHKLVHQMGNRTESMRFVSLHLYGNHQRKANITADARVFNLTEGLIQRTDGGVFLGLSEDAVKASEPGPQPDYATWLRDVVLHAKRLILADKPLTAVQRQLVDTDQWELFSNDVSSRIDAEGHVIDSRYWSHLRNTLIEAAHLERVLFEQRSEPSDEWTTYARLYDHIIGTTNDFIPRYITKLFHAKRIEPSSCSFLDIGCGTGWLGKTLIKTLGMSPAHVEGIDPSDAMISIASERIKAMRGSVLDLKTIGRQWDITFCNVIEYLPHAHVEEAIQNLAYATKSGGWFIGDFLTQDHIRWYPHLIRSEDNQVISLRHPSLVNRGGHMYQENEIVNLSRLSGDVRVTYEGRHYRYLPPLSKIRQYFRSAFNSQVEMFDARSMHKLPESAETTESTRYVICVRRNG